MPWLEECEIVEFGDFEPRPALYARNDSGEPALFSDSEGFYYWSYDLVYHTASRPPSWRNRLLDAIVAWLSALKR